LNYNSRSTIQRQWNLKKKRKKEGEADLVWRELLVWEVDERFRAVVHGGAEVEGAVVVNAGERRKIGRGRRKVSMVILDMEMTDWRSCRGLAEEMVMDKPEVMAVSGWNGGEKKRKKWQNNW
jgi:hypothetical protein